MSSNGQDSPWGDPGEGAQRGPSFDDPTKPPSMPPQQPPAQSWDQAWGLTDEPQPNAGAAWPQQSTDAPQYGSPATQDPYGQQQNPYAGQQQNPYGEQQDPWGAEPNPYAAQPYPSHNLYGQPDPYQQPYGAYGGYGMYGHGQPIKSKVTAAVLAFFLGTFGAHSFYLGKKISGIVHLVLGIGGFLIMMAAGGALTDAASGDDILPSFIVLMGLMMVMSNAIFAFVEFIIILIKPEHELGR